MASASCFPAICFGKLPTFADFVRHNAGGREVLAFDQWLQQGIHHARTQLRDDWDASYHGAPAYQFLFFPENSESFLLGVLQPSQDHSERTYPFIVSLRVDRRLPPNRLPLAPLIFTSFFDRAGELIAAAAYGMSSQELADRTEELQVPVERDYAALSREYETYLATTSSSRLCEQLWGADGKERIFLVLKNLVDVLLPLRGRSAARLALGLRFPLPTQSPDLHRAASFWLLAAFAVMGVNSPRPFFFWTTPVPGPATDSRSNGTEPGPLTLDAAHLFLFLRQPSASHVLHLLRPDLNSDSICEVDIDGLDALGSARSMLPSRLVAAVSAGDKSLLEMLDILGGRLLGHSGPHARTLI